MPQSPWPLRLAVLVGGMVGGGARIGLSSAVTDLGRWPWGTFVVNITGALALGYLLTRSLRSPRAALLIPLLGTGLLGSYTTFSTFSLETWRLMESGEVGVALGYAIASVALGFAAAVTGMRLARTRR